jgi:hypothetical protein
MKSMGKTCKKITAGEEWDSVHRRIVRGSANYQSPGFSCRSQARRSLAVASKGNEKGGFATQTQPDMGVNSLGFPAIFRTNR